ncbi:MAG: 2-polyprenyl-3-methyl-6-methoxy-1,4-benzoquinone monooxygenase, partial [Pseudomonadales bacterium]|nr:2-polyprenyl-3-methyl-6-methoxy-1,4-benzoquinone monooxygenase [Pseudomonadales bacterium]
NTRPIHQPSPARMIEEDGSLSDSEKKHAAGLMRVNHTGEVMAQALYQGQALTARLQSVREQMERAADEEIDHLAWCEERVKQLDGHTSILNPLWYGLSFGMGAVAGLVSDKHSLGLVSAIEDQVCEHLEGHLQSLPASDNKSRVIVQKMLEDEARHSEQAQEAGGKKFPLPVKKGMSMLSRLMTKSSYRI